MNKAQILQKGVGEFFADIPDHPVPDAVKKKLTEVEQDESARERMLKCLGMALHTGATEDDALQTLYEYEHNPFADFGYNKARKKLGYEWREEGRQLNLTRAIIEAKQNLIDIIPEKYKQDTIDSWTTPTPIAVDCKHKAQRIINKDCLQVWSGPTGRGKTMLAYCLGKTLAKLGYFFQLESWDYIYSLMTSTTTFNRDGQEKARTLHMRDLNKYYLLVIDDFTGLTTGSRFIESGFYELINIRTAEKLKTIIITKIKKEELAGNLGHMRDNIKRRILDDGGIIDFWELPMYNIQDV